MTRKLLLICSIALAANLQASACSICGCGGGNVYLGLMPDFQHQFFGIRYQYSYFHTQLLNDPSQFSKNYYNEMEVWGGINLSRKVRILAFVPYYQNQQIDDDGRMSTHGLGDVSVMGQYQVFHSYTPLSKSTLLEQQLWIGGGLKLPTGAFNVDALDSNTTVADINAQLGTGSVDFLVAGMYSVRINRLVLNASASYKINTTNKDDYRYGNKFNGNLLLSYRIPAGKNSVSPNLGIGYEQVASNTLQRKEVEFTGSHMTTAIAGVEYAIRKIGIGVNAQIPLYQNFAEGQTQLRVKAMAHVSFAF